MRSVPVIERRECSLRFREWHPRRIRTLLTILHVSRRIESLNKNHPETPLWTPRKRSITRIGIISGMLYARRGAFPQETSNYHLSDIWQCKMPRAASRKSLREIWKQSQPELHLATDAFPPRYRWCSLYCLGWRGVNGQSRRFSISSRSGEVGK